MKYLSLLIFSLIAIFSCVGDDFIDDRVDPVLRITNPLQSLVQDTSIQIQYTFKNNIGLEEDIQVEWTSEDLNIAEINENGFLTSKAKGTTTITAFTEFENKRIEDFFVLEVSEKTVIVETVDERTGSLNPSSFYELEGDFTLTQEEDKLLLTFNSNYSADTGLPGLYVYLTNNPNSVNGAKVIGKVENFSGSHSYEIDDSDLFDYSHVLYFCKPFNVKVGDGELSN